MVRTTLLRLCEPAGSSEPTLNSAPKSADGSLVPEDEYPEERSAVATIERFVSDDPQQIDGWSSKSPGQQRLAMELTDALDGSGVVLHSRTFAGTRLGIDHLVVAPTGIWVIDARADEGRIEWRDHGDAHRPDRRLYVGGADETHSIGPLAHKVASLRRALEPCGFAGAPVTTAVCFADADFALRAEPFRIIGTWVSWSRRLTELVLEQELFSVEAIQIVAEQLASTLPPAD